MFLLLEDITLCQLFCFLLSPQTSGKRWQLKHRKSDAQLNIALVFKAGRRIGTEWAKEQDRHNCLSLCSHLRFLLSPLRAGHCRKTRASDCHTKSLPVAALTATKTPFPSTTQTHLNSQSCQLRQPWQMSPLASPTGRQPNCLLHFRPHIQTEGIL